MRNTGFHGLPDATEVDAEGFLPARLVHLVQFDPAGPDAGVGHDDVQTSELLDTVVDCGLECRLVANVDLRGDHPSIEILDHVRGFGEILWGGRRRGRRVEPTADVDGDDVGTFLGEANRMASPR